MSTDKGLVVKFSKSYKEFMQKMLTSGYALSDANVNFVVWWKDETTGVETRIVLPRVVFARVEIPGGDGSL